MTKSRLRNKGVNSALRTQIKKLKTAISGGDAALAQVELARTYQVLDVAARKGVIHKGNASRRKARMANAVNKMA